MKLSLTAVHAHAALPVGIYVGSFFLPLFLSITSHALSICMFSDALSASPCLFGGGYGVGVELAECAFLLAWLTCLLP